MRVPIIRHIKNEMVKRSEIRSAAQSLLKLQIDSYIREHLSGNPRYDDPKRLARFEYSVWSQFGEDGIIAEIFRRIGESSRAFIEIGVGDGLENNTACLLTRQWRGAWIEGSKRNSELIERRFSPVIQEERLRFRRATVTAENIEGLLAELRAPPELDLLSLDIDYNTYWVWKAITTYRPRAVVVEYNAAFPPESLWAVRYDPGKSWDGSSHMSASLGALCVLGKSKGYSLVGCSFAGSNAFFIRDDLTASHFCEPFTAPNHYEPPRYFLYTDRGHRRGWGEFVVVNPENGEPA